MPGFVSRKGDSIVFNGEGEFVFYVPEKYFDTKNAIIEGEYVNILGVLDYAIFDKNGKHSGLKPFKLPTVFLTKPYTIDKLKDVQLTKNVDKQDYRLFKYKIFLLSCLIASNATSLSSLNPSITNFKAHLDFLTTSITNDFL